jgi:hypothetical protein
MVAGSYAFLPIKKIPAYRVPRMRVSAKCYRFTAGGFLYQLFVLSGNVADLIHAWVYGIALEIQICQRRQCD